MTCIQREIRVNVRIWPDGTTEVLGFTPDKGKVRHPSKVKWRRCLWSPRQQNGLMSRRVALQLVESIFQEAERLADEALRGGYSLPDLR